MEQIRQQYRGKMKQFYFVVGLILGLVKTNIDKFKNFKAKYTIQMVTDLEDKLAAAEDLPDAATSIAARALLRIKLLALADALRELWQALKSYVESSYQEDEWEQTLKAAGWDEYGAPDDWQSTKKLGEKAMAFVAENSATLMANNNMPADFEGKLKTSVANYKEGLKKFGESNNTKLDVTNEKMKANNALYEDIVSISRDASVIYKKIDPEKRKQYSYGFQLDVLKGGAASIRGTVTDLNGVGIGNVHIESTDGKRNTVTSSTGAFKIERLKEGDWIFVITCEGYQPVQVPVTLKAGTAHTIHVKLSQAMEAVA